MKALSKSKFMTKVVNDKYKKRLAEKSADRYVFLKKQECFYKDAMHKGRQPHWKSK